MPDFQHYDYLLKCLGEPSGSQRWRQYKQAHEWMDLSGADFTEYHLRGYNLSNINFCNSILLACELVGVNLARAVLAGADLRRAILRGARLEHADLQEANLAEAILTDAVLEHADLSGARLSGADLIGADLSNVDLTGADLRRANLKYVRLVGAELTGANVAGANLTGAVMDDDAPALLKHFRMARIDDRRYRELRCRLMTQAGPLAPLGASAQDEPPARLKGHRPAPGWSSGLGQGPAAIEDGIPVREREPDLATTEGCLQVLDLPSGAIPDQIVKAFRKKAKLFHPDRVRHLPVRLQELAAQEFRRVRTAYEQLTRHTARPLTGVRWPHGVPHYESPYDYTSEHYEMLARANPGNTDILYNLAWAYFEEGRLAEAIAGFEKVLEADPEDNDAWHNLMIVRLCAELDIPPVLPRLEGSAE